MKKLEEYVRSIPDFPEPGIIFRDVTTILQDADGLHLAVDSIRNMLKDVDYDVVVGPESRGFIFGVPVAYAEHKGFVPVRKRVNCHVKLFLPNMPWNMAQLRSRCIRIPLNRVRRLLSLTI